MSRINIEFENYNDQLVRWPKSGKVILAQYDEEGVIVYQAYNKYIGHYAVKNGRFGGGFSFSRMTWIKPNFLWMMYRSGWGAKENQEVTLAIKIRRAAFDRILSLAVPSSFDPDRYETKSSWQENVKDSEVRFQWDPDHDPFGEKQSRRAIQLGLRGEAVRCYAGDWILGISDISDFVKEQRVNVEKGNLDMLCMPRESVYFPDDDALSKKLNLDI